MRCAMKFPKEKDRHALVMHDGLNWKRKILAFMRDALFFLRFRFRADEVFYQN